MTRYYCSGFDINNAFGHGLGYMFLRELKDTKSIVYIPGSPEKIQKAREKYIPEFTEHLKNVGIQFDSSIIITPEMNSDEAGKCRQKPQSAVGNSNMKNHMAVVANINELI